MSALVVTCRHRHLLSRKKKNPPVFRRKEPVLGLRRRKDLEGCEKLDSVMEALSELNSCLVVYTETSAQQVDMPLFCSVRGNSVGVTFTGRQRHTSVTISRQYAGTYISRQYAGTLLSLGLLADIYEVDGHILPTRNLRRCRTSPLQDKSKAKKRSMRGGDQYVVVSCRSRGSC